jgi:hypothetical protein
MSQHQTMGDSLRPLVSLVWRPKCQRGPRVDGRPTRKGLKQVHNLKTLLQAIETIRKCLIGAAL